RRPWPPPRKGASNDFLASPRSNPAQRPRDGGPEMQRVSDTDAARVTGTDFITQPVSDYETAAKFYGETLGLEFSKRWGNMPAGEFETGSLTIALMEPSA